MIKQLKSFFSNKSLLVFGVMFFLLALLRILNPNYIESITHLSLDSYQKIFKHKLTNTPVVIVDIDEKSIGAIGQFPWNRKVFGDLTKILNENGASVIAFDIFFSEHDKQNPQEILKAFNLKKSSRLGKEISKLPNNDEYFLQQIQSGNIVLPIVGLVQEPTNSTKQKPKAKYIIKGKDPKQSIFSFAHHLTSLEKINIHAKGIGSISVISGTDGILRKVPLLLNIQNEIFPSISIEALRIKEKQKNILIQSSELGIEAIKLRPFTIQTNPNAMFWVKYKEPLKQQYISAVDILENKINPETFKGKTILVGSSAQGLFDFVKTPAGLVIPGVEVHANIIENIINQDVLQRDTNSFLIEFAILILGMIFSFFFADNARPKWSIVFYLGMVLMVLVLGSSLYQNNLLVDISYPIFSITILFMSGLYLRYLRENAMSQEFEKKQMLLKQEREIAGEVQKKLFPVLEKSEERIYGANVPARDVSGDYFDIIKINQHEFYFTLADVSGKGIKAGILMASASAVFKSLAKTNNSISNISLRMNNQVSESSYQGMFVTAVIGKVNLETGDVEFINHGHEPIMVVDQAKQFKYIESSFPPLGIIPTDDESFFETTKQNFKGKNLLIYTDGITEGYLNNGSGLGASGYETIITKSKETNPKKIITLVIEALQSDYLRDDITCLGIKI